MNKKVIHKVNGGLAIYYGIGCALASVSGLIISGFILFKKLTGAANFSWWSFAFPVAVALVMGVIGYAILRVGYEEIER